jgi:serine/threonine protein kinase
MERLNHPNIAKFVDAIDTSKIVYIMMEYLGGGSLHQYLKKRTSRRLEELKARRIFVQACQALKYLHSHCIVHRDIKLENLLLDESGVLKIIDFGFSTIVPPGKKIRVFCGTPSYMAPEIVCRKEHPGANTDVWAIGVVFFAMLCGTFPFKAQNDRELYRRIAKGVFMFPDVPVCKEAVSLVQRMLTVDISRRPTIVDVLADPWIKQATVQAASAEEVKPVVKHSTSISSQTTAASAYGSKTESKEAFESKGDSGVEPRSQSKEVREVDSQITREADASVLKAATSEHDAWSGMTLRTIGVTSCEPKTHIANPPPHSEATVSNAPTGAAEEEAIMKLQRLGYGRDEIIRQLKDENSHLYKLYYRFLKALNAWECSA